MSGVLVFVPCSPERALALSDGESFASCQAFAVTPSLLRALDLTPADDEDAEYGCMLLASVWGLAQYGTRLVLVAEVPQGQVSEGDDADNGGVRVSGLRLGHVQSFFTDEAGQSLVAEASRAVEGLGLDEAWETDEVQQLMRRTSLLWHSVEELARLGKDV